MRSLGEEIKSFFGFIGCSLGIHDFPSHEQGKYRRRLSWCRREGCSAKRLESW